LQSGADAKHTPRGSHADANIYSDRARRIATLRNADTYSNSNCDTYSDSDCYINCDSHINTQSNADAAASANTEDTAHPAAAPLAFAYEKETHCTIRTCPPVCSRKLSE
jgi:hypothetical protein